MLNIETENLRKSWSEKRIGRIIRSLNSHISFLTPYAPAFHQRHSRQNRNDKEAERNQRRYARSFLVLTRSVTRFFVARQLRPSVHSLLKRRVLNEFVRLRKIPHGSNILRGIHRMEMMRIHVRLKRKAFRHFIWMIFGRMLNIGRFLRRLRNCASRFEIWILAHPTSSTCALN